MIQIIPCPACQRSTVLLEGVSLEATIQCPHCEEQFVVGELLTSVFGTWNVITDPAMPHGNEEELRLADEEEQTTAPRPMLAGTTGGTTGGIKNRRLSRKRGKVNPNVDWSKFEPITYEEFERLRRQGGSPIRTVIQIALGGLLAIPVSLLLIWHVLGTDVMGAGPLVGRYAPWIVPTRYRPAARDEQMAETSVPQPPPAGASGFRQFDDEIGHGRVAPPDTNAPDTDEGAAGQPSTAGKMPGGNQGTEADSSTAGTSDDAGSKGEATSSEAATSSSVPSPVGKSLPVSGVDAPESSNSNKPAASAIAPPNNDRASADSNAFDLIRRTDQHLDEWKSENSTEEQRQERSNTIYRDLLELATSLNSVPKENPVLRTMREQMQPIGRSIKGDEGLQQAIALRAKQWIERNGGDRFPMACIVEIQTANEAGEYWEIIPSEQSQLSGPQGQYKISIPQVLAPSLMSGQRLLLLGSVSQLNASASTASPATGANAGSPSPPTSQDEGDAANQASTAITGEGATAPKSATFVADYLHAL